MTQQVKGFVTKSNDLSVTLGTHTVEERNQ